METRPSIDAPRPCAPRLARTSDAEQPAFVPLRLLLHPGGLCVEMNKPDMLVGRHSAADIRLSLPDVSRQHCRFVFADGAWRVFDLNSLNGIFVNGERLQEASVNHGDRIRIGSLTFAIEVGVEQTINPALEPTNVRPSRMVGPREDSEMRKAS
jgi:predicted component of type VI protein secretion system